MANRDIETQFKKDSIEASKPAKKETRGRPKGVKNGQGKKKPQRKKASQKTAERKSSLRKEEREKLRKLLCEHFGASHVDKQLLGLETIKAYSDKLLDLRRAMEIQLEEQRIEAEEYYAQIDQDYKKVGRPKSIFNERELKYLISIQCTLDEIAGFFQMHKDVLRKKVQEEYEISWAEFYERNSQGVKVALRRRQVQSAMEGDTQMLKFLGKNLLGQKEKIDFDGEVKVNSWVDLVSNLEDDKEGENVGDDGHGET